MSNKYKKRKKLKEVSKLFKRDKEGKVEIGRSQHAKVVWKLNKEFKNNIIFKG